MLWLWKAMKKWVKSHCVLACTWKHLCVFIVYMSKNVKCAAWKVSLTSKLLTETEWHLCLSAGLGVCAHRWGGRQRNVTGSNSSLQVWALRPSNSSQCRQVWIGWYLAPQAHIRYSAMCCWENMLPKFLVLQSAPPTPSPTLYPQLGPLLANCLWPHLEGFASSTIEFRTLALVHWISP